MAKNIFFRKRSKNEIRSFSSNDFYKNDNCENEEIKTNSNNDVETKNEKINKYKTPKKYQANKNYFTNKTIPYKNKKIKKNKPYGKDELFNKYNNQSAAEKLKIFQIKKINRAIDDLLSKDEQRIKQNEIRGINFFLFCEILFKLGYVYFLHKNKLDSELNDEYIKNIISQPYLNKSQITKEFTCNEIILIDKAFNSIRNNFNLQSNSNENEKSKENILSINCHKLFYIDKIFIRKKEKTANNNNNDIEDFKLFIFILSNIFEGYGFEKDEKENIPSRKSTDSIKTIDQINIKNNSIVNSTKTNKVKNNERLKKNNIINNLISKLISSKNLNAFIYQDIMNYKNYIKYMIEINQEHIIFYENEKKK